MQGNISCASVPAFYANKKKSIVFFCITIIDCMTYSGLDLLPVYKFLHPGTDIYIYVCVETNTKYSAL